MNKLRRRSALRDKQHLIYDYIIQNDAHLIVSAMGSGKSGATLTAIRDLLDMFAIRHVLVIAPKFVAQRTWPDEIETWEHTRCMSYAVAVHDNPKKRAEAIEERAEITLINFESLQWLAKHLGTINNWYWDCVIIDESSRFKAGKKRTTRARVKDAKGNMKIRKGGNMTRFGVVSTARKKIDRIYELTGTPFPQGIHDAWGQIYLLDQGERLGQSMTAFEDRWFNKNKYTHQIKEKPGAEGEIMSLISDVMVTIPQEQLVEEPLFIPVKVSLPPKAAREYRDFERTLYSEAYDVEAVSKGVLANKLLQFANGSLYREDKEVVPVHTAKLDALGEIVAQSQGENLLVFYGFKFDKDAILKKYPHAVVANEDPDAIRKWNAGEIPMLLAHPASIGHGTNLQYGGHIAVWYGLPWSLELYLQANMRLPRPGQTKRVLIYQIIAEGTYDEDALRVLGIKDARQDMLTQITLHRLENFST
jgi:SNF2 family DNA or RNA helicase